MRFIKGVVRGTMSDRALAATAVVGEFSRNGPPCELPVGVVTATRVTPRMFFFLLLFFSFSFSPFFASLFDYFYYYTFFF